MLINTEILFTQTPAGDFSGSITGYVYDMDNTDPLEYANIILHNQKDSLQVNGTITNKNGIFNISVKRPGKYYLDIYFMGYEKKRIDDISINPQNNEIKLGAIPLKKAIFTSEGIEIEAQRPAVSYQIDKKVINVSEQFTAISGTAVDVLENVPSVTVDIEGNVALRGSENFIVLIDGRPTILEPSEALQQIPASIIENIEIITNPSARYDPDGNAGIINVIMKKNTGQGISGVVNINGGLKNKYGGDFLYQYRYNRWNFILGADYNRRDGPGTMLSENRTTRSNVTTFTNSDGDSERKRKYYSFRGSIELDLTASDFISTGFRYGGRSFAMENQLDYNEWSDTSAVRLLYTSLTSRDNSGDFYSVNLDYRHKFRAKEHELTAQMIFDHRGGDEESKDELINEQNITTSGRISTEKGPGDRIRTKIDYKLPFNDNYKFESGYQSRFSLSEDNTGLFQYDPAGLHYTYIPEYSHRIEYHRNIHSIYTIFSGETNSFGYQGGIRGEYTSRLIKFSGESQEYVLDRWDYFPAFHVSFKFSERKQIMGSYTRRIERPRGWNLEPFETWMDAYNVRIGNPALKPEYIDSYEMAYQTTIGNSIFSTELYYRVNHNKVERVRSVYSPGVYLHSIANVGTDYSFGSELLINTNILKNWNINLTANLYDYRVEGILYGESFSRESFNWNTRLNNDLKLGKTVKFQINTQYNSPAVSSQGRREGFFRTNIALRKDFLNRNIIATFQIRDIFKTGKYEFTSNGPDFHTYNHFTREAPVIILNIRFNINKFKKKNDRYRETDNENGESEGEEEF
jgi:outer membrane cobalamin receptor